MATPRQVGARNDVWCVVARLTKSAEAISEIAAHLSGARNDSKIGGLLARTNVVSTLAGGFVLGAEASRADVDFSAPSFYHNRSSVNIRQPASGGMLFGMAYTTPKSSSFTANITLHRNFSLLLNQPRKSSDFHGYPVNLKFCQ